MVVQFSYGFTADGANRNLSFLDWGPFRRWIATDCDRPFFESTCFYESRNSTGIIFVFYFSNLSSFSFCFFVWRFSWGAFFKIQFHCGLDQVRMCLSISVLHFLCFQNLLVFRVSCWLLVLSASWMQMVTGIWTLNLLLWFLVTSIRQPIHGPHPLIGRSSTSVNWIFISSLPFWMKPEEIFFPIFRRRVCSSSWKTYSGWVQFLLV